MIKRSRGKKQQEETEKQQYIIVTENNILKGFTTEGSPASLTVASHGIPYDVEDSLPVDP